MTDNITATADRPPEPDDLTCPVCDYDLRGLPNPRCPECGYAFDWAELIERLRRRQLWFFEHAGTLRSLLKTRWRSLRPRSFWSRIHAYSDAHAGRLAKYRGVTFLLLVIATLLMLGLRPAQQWLAVQLPQPRSVTTFTRPNVPYNVTVQYAPGYYGLPATPTTTQSAAGKGQGTAVQLTYVPGQTFYQYVIPGPSWAAWVRPLVSVPYGGSDIFARIGWAGLLSGCLIVALPLYWRVLRASVIRASIRPMHLARVDAYSVDVLPLVVGMYAVAEYAFDSVLPDFGSEAGFEGIVLHLLIGPIVIISLLTLRLRSALRHYVRFPQASAVAFGYATIATLAWLIALLRFTSFC